jgi:hypothetical protein
MLVERLVVKGGGAKAVREQCGISAERWGVFEEARADRHERRAMGARCCAEPCLGCNLAWPGKRALSW